jgi:DNA-binding transcriptional regulator YhcF (GntR family)
MHGPGRHRDDVERLIVGYWLAGTALLINVGCAILALIVKDSQVFLVAWAGACFTVYGLFYYHETRRMPMGYRSLAMQLRWDITNSDDGYQPGQKLPAVVDIAKKYGTTHTTAMRAMRVLAAEGLVDIVHGRGTYYVGADRIPQDGGEPEARVEKHLKDITDRVPAGHPIPSVRSLAAAHKISAVIIQRVLTDFAHRGLIRTTRAGGFVRT